MNSLAQQKLNEIKAILDNSGLTNPDKQELMKEFNKTHGEQHDDERQSYTDDQRKTGQGGQPQTYEQAQQAGLKNQQGQDPAGQNKGGKK